MESMEVDTTAKETFSTAPKITEISDSERNTNVEPNIESISANDSKSPFPTVKVIPTSDAVEKPVVDSNDSTSTTKKTKSVIHTLQPKVYVPPIEETIDLENRKDYIDRFFTQRYCIDVNQKFNDHCVLIHSNKICVITLAPSHPLICSDIKIEKINFQVSKNVNRMNNKISGKRKRNAQNLNQTSPLCYVECSDNKVFTIYSIVPGKLLEMNDQLENDPEKIRECCPTFPHKQCYVAVVLPNIRHTVETLNKNFLTPEQYQKAVEERNHGKGAE